MNGILILAMLFALIGLGVVGLIGYILGNRHSTEKHQKDAVAKGHGRYNPETAKFEWLIVPGAHTGQE